MNYRWALPSLLFIGWAITIFAHPPLRTDKEKQFYDAVLLMEQGFYPEALKRLDSVLIKDSTHQNAILMRGVCYQKMDSFDQAVKNFKIALQRAPKNTDNLMFLSGAYEAYPIWDSAIFYYSKAYSLDSNLIKAQAGLLKAYSETGNWAKVLESINRIEKKGLIGPQIDYYKGLSTLNMADTSTAILLLKAALKKDPNYGKASFSLAKLYLDLATEDSAKKFLNIFIDGKNDKDGRAYLLRAEINLHGKDTLHALIDLNEVIHLSPGNSRAYFLRAPTKVFYGDSAGACEDLQLAFSDTLSHDSTLYFRYNCGIKKDSIQTD